MKQPSKTPTPTRRAFVKATAALSVAPMLIPRSAFGANDKVVMGCIGMGNMGGGNMGAFLGMEDVRVVHVCDVDDGRAANAKNAVDGRYGNKDCKSTRFFEEIIAREDIDAVLIATPDHWHGITAIAAARAKKDIYCQKPVTHLFTEGRVLADECKKNDVVFQVGSQQRSAFNFRWAVELVLNGHIGKVRHIDVGLPGGHRSGPAPQPDAKPPANVDYDRWCGPSEVAPFHPNRFHNEWRWHLSYGGGQLMDWIGHHNDIAHWGMDWDSTGPVEVQAVGFEYPPDRTVWNAAFSYEVKCVYANGTTTSLSNKHPMGAKWYGENDRWVRVDRGHLSASDPAWTKNDFDRGPKKAYESNHHERNFIDCVKSRKPAICPAETGHRSITPGHLGLVSQAVGGKVLRFDPATETITSDAEADKMLKAIDYRAPWKL